MSKYNLTDILEQYKIGSGWTTDFDYDGMLKTGLGTSIDTPIEVLKKIFEDFTDVNYHREAEHLHYAIEAIEIGDMMEAQGKISDFHAEIRKTQGEQGMDIEPTVGQFMASKMEEGKGVEEVGLKEKDELSLNDISQMMFDMDYDSLPPSKQEMVREKDEELFLKEVVGEVSSREGSRMEGLVDQRLKAKFLDIFADLYFDLTDEDPFQAEDVVDYLGIEMLKHLDNIQAQGDRLASLEETEEIDEVESVEEGISTSDIAKALKDDAKATDSEIKQYMASVKKAGDKFDDVDDYVEDFKNYVADKSLQEHFGRFMKDYQ